MEQVLRYKQTCKAQVWEKLTGRLVRKRRASEQQNLNTANKLQLHHVIQKQCFNQSEEQAVYEQQHQRGKQK